MAQNRLVFDGLAQFRQQLRNLPENLQQDAAGIVDDTSAAAATEIEHNYPTGPTGNLKRGVSRQRGVSRFGASVLVKSRAKHANIFEHGTKQRRTDKGANRGAMPQPPEHQRMVPIVIKHRRRMVEKLKDLVRSAGFHVE